MCFISLVFMHVMVAMMIRVPICAMVTVIVTIVIKIFCTLANLGLAVGSKYWVTILIYDRRIVPVFFFTSGAEQER